MDDELETIELEEEERETIETGSMPAGNLLNLPLRRDQVVISEGGRKAPAYDDDAAATLVWRNYETARAYLETSTWLAEWQASDVVYQSPNYDRWNRVQDGRPVRISRFLVAKNTNTMDNQVHRGIFANQKPFVLEAEGETDQTHVEAWTHLIWTLMKRAKFEYNLGLLIECQGLQGTGVGQPGWEERTITKKRRRRKKAAQKINQPIGGPVTVPTESSDDFEVVPETVIESYPFFDFKRLGTVLFDPKWNTPNKPAESSNYVIDVDYVAFHQLQQLRTLSCYKNIPDDKTLADYFFSHDTGDAPPASTVADDFTDKSSSVFHAAGEQAKTSIDPLERELMLLSMWTMERVVSILCYEGQRLTIRNDEHDMGEHAMHYTANWWNIPNSGWGLGIGRLNNGDQRMEQGVLNESLKMIAYPFNAPILYNAEDGNAPTQNVVAGMGTFWGVRPGRNGNVSDAVKFMERPAPVPEAWEFLRYAKDGGEDLVGANSTTMQGNLGGPGSSAMRTATGVNRVGNKADDNISKPVRHLEWLIESFINFLIDMVRLKMPLAEIRKILRKRYSKAIIDQIDMEVFLDAEMTVNVLVGSRLLAKAAIQQLIPFFLQITQQPQLMEYNHQKGWTIDFLVMEKMFLQMSEFNDNDNIFRPMTADELKTFQSNNPGAQKVQGAIAVEQQRGKNKLAEVEAETQKDVTTTLAKTAAEHAAGSVPLERAQGMLERNVDEKELQNGVPDPLA